MIMKSTAPTLCFKTFRCSSFTPARSLETFWNCLMDCELFDNLHLYSTNHTLFFDTDLMNNSYKEIRKVRSHFNVYCLTLYLVSYSPLHKITYIISQNFSLPSFNANFLYITSFSCMLSTVLNVTSEKCS